MPHSRAVLVLEIDPEVERCLDELLARAEVPGSRIHASREGVARIALLRGVRELLVELRVGERRQRA